MSLFSPKYCLKWIKYGQNVFWLAVFQIKDQKALLFITVESQIKAGILLHLTVITEFGAHVGITRTKLCILSKFHQR